MTRRRLQSARTETNTHTTTSCFTSQIVVFGGQRQETFPWRASACLCWLGRRTACDIVLGMFRTLIAGIINRTQNAIVVMVMVGFLKFGCLLFYASLIFTRMKLPLEVIWLQFCRGVTQCHCHCHSQPNDRWFPPPHWSFLALIKTSGFFLFVAAALPE